jgi:hypothetical protein
VDQHPDPEPSSRQTPWWYGKAKRDHILIGFCVLALLISSAIFVIIVWGLKP